MKKLIATLLLAIAVPAMAHGPHGYWRPHPSGGWGWVAPVVIGGAIGDTPIIARAQGILASDPLPADTLFGKAAKGQYDGVVAMYHDQGLIPLKLVAFGTSVNVTVGLPIIRTSVDHGTAFDIVGKGIADPGSLLEAVNLAATIAKNRPATG